jgi:hypothetical protein
MLGRLEMTMNEAISPYKKVGHKVFGRERKKSLGGKIAPRCKSRYLETCLQYATQQDRLDLAEAYRSRSAVAKDFPKSRKEHDFIKSKADRVTLESGNPDSTRT